MEYGEDSLLRPFKRDPQCCLVEEDFYVPLNLDYSVWDGDERQSVKVELETLFDCPVQGRAKMVLLTGDAGFGKTALCKKLAFDWSHERTAVRALPCDSTVVVLCELKYLNSGKSLTEELFNFMYERHSLEAKTKKATENSVKSLGKDLLLILDGYDDLDEWKKPQLTTLLELGTVFMHACILVTSRPTNKKEFLKHFDKRYSIGKRTRDRTQQLVLKHFQNNEEQSVEFLRLYLNKELEDMSPLAISLLCWASQQKGQDQLSYGGDLLFQGLTLLARHCNDRLSLQLTDEEIEKGFFRFGQLCYVYEYDHVFPRSTPHGILEDSRLIQLAEDMGVLKFCETEGGLLRFDSVYGEFRKCLSDCFFHAALEIRRKFSQGDYERFIYDFFASNPDIALYDDLNANFSAGGDPVFTFRSQILKLTYTISEIVLEFLVVPKVTRILNITYDLLIKYFTYKEPLIDFKDPDCYFQANRETTWVERIITPFVKEECPDERKTFLLFLLRGRLFYSIRVQFEDQLDSRFLEMLDIVVDCFTKGPKSYRMSFEFPQGVNDEKRFLTSLLKALGVLEDTRFLSAEKLREEIATWAKKQTPKTYFDDDWKNGTGAYCSLSRIIDIKRFQSCEFILRRESKEDQPSSLSNRYAPKL